MGLESITRRQGSLVLSGALLNRSQRKPDRRASWYNWNTRKWNEVSLS